MSTVFGVGVPGFFGREASSCFIRASERAARPPTRIIGPSQVFWAQPGLALLTSGHGPESGASSSRGSRTCAAAAAAAAATASGARAAMRVPSRVEGSLSGSRFGSLGSTIREDTRARLTCDGLSAAIRVNFVAPTSLRTCAVGRARSLPTTVSTGPETDTPRTNSGGFVARYALCTDCGIGPVGGMNSTAAPISAAATPSRGRSPRTITMCSGAAEAPRAITIAAAVS